MIRKIEKANILFGMNDTEHFINEITKVKDSSVSVQDVYEKTKSKRKWSLLNPGFMIGVAHCYLGALKETKNVNWEIITLPKFTIDDGEKHTINSNMKFIRRLRNSIAHHNYYIEEDSEIDNDSRFVIVFTDMNPKNNDDFITFRVGMIDFFNLVSNCGKLFYNMATSDNK